jgi:hypothetical protein
VPFRHAQGPEPAEGLVGQEAGEKIPVAGQVENAQLARRRSLAIWQENYSEKRLFIQSQSLNQGVPGIGSGIISCVDCFTVPDRQRIMRAGLDQVVAAVSLRAARSFAAIVCIAD